MGESRDTSNTSVRAYVPAYQKAAWKDHADELEMSLSEFVRAMVQAGRRGFETGHEEPDSSDATPGGNALETQVLELLAADTYSWEELLEAVTDDVESRLDDTLGELQSANRIRYSGRHGGYTLVEGEPNGD
ncbi:DUF5805 domain-containing protein [Natronobeatus ordinarius]|uniref:DUF5805 domain-containing protein n=1 Tax=Natronobeatus ordinarius TaxID=2963433 RepID=UPI0020CC27F8|nr:DUF5805 domain-containing protein [Natronobeatus ordinarius]